MVKVVPDLAPCCLSAFVSRQHQTLDSLGLAPWLPANDLSLHLYLMKFPIFLKIPSKSLYSIIHKSKSLNVFCRGNDPWPSVAFCSISSLAFSIDHLILPLVIICFFSCAKLKILSGWGASLIVILVRVKWTYIPLNPARDLGGGVEVIKGPIFFLFFG